MFVEKLEKFSHNALHMNQNQTATCTSECGLCEANSAHLIESHDRHGKSLSVVICGNCGVIHNDPIPSASDLSQFYTYEYRKSYKGTSEPKLRHSARYFPNASQHIQQHWRYYKATKRILDIGSGSGEFVFLMRELDKDAAGLEPTRDYAEFCQKRFGLDITIGEIDTFYPIGGYDHIRLHHVVEHLRDPIANLRRISEWLNKGGTIYVEVPDFEQDCRDKTPGRMFHYGHIYNFDRSSFTYLVESAGLQILERTGSTSAFLGRPDQARPDQTRPDQTWDIPSKIDFYQMHKSGKLKEKSRAAKILKKISKSWKEHKIIKSKGTHLNIANQVAMDLRQSLHL